MLDYHRPPSSRPTSRLIPRLSDSPEQYSTPLPPPTLETAVQPATPVSTPPSPLFNATGSFDPGQRTSSRSPSPKLRLLPVPDRLSASRPDSAASSQGFETPLPSPSTSASYRTPSVSPSGIPSDNGDAGEDVDSFYVRSTYARLDQSGVPGDGYEEGVERTRARAPGKAQKRATVFNEKLSELSQKEIEILSSLDRYGFKPPKMSSHQENRLALIPLAPLKTDLRPIKTPPLSPPAPANEIRDMPPMSGVDPKETTRIDKWARMMKVAQRDKGGNIERWSFDEKKKRKLRERVYKGVPDRWRSAAWWTIIDSARLEEVCPPNVSTPSRPRVPTSQLIDLYPSLVDKPSTHDIQIDLDVPRTISGHFMFHTRYGSGQRALFHVLHAFSQLCDDCGYCQGMGPIAATLLCYLEPERVYACLVRIHDSYDMHSIFSPGFPGLLESIYVQEKLTEKLMPDVYNSFKKHMICSTSYATKWYITLFANTFPFQTQLRLWDAFFLEGRDVIVIIALSIIWVLRDHLASAQASFETILSLLSSFFFAESEDALLSWIQNALGDKKLRAQMTGWRSEWRQLVKEGKEGTALL
ncbi:hypothetical protein M407DRAFT_72470 [Tulasnella calospora MUT 4182]|uniref:Rab-GAP TBC domain-containing protein n=1 Tax=Tulasnella calospora MUT 4182 TaxID=1051891 RepID=A0A0C3L2D1_9AGAM|nr:hypothetical protein M407DRAFT_72470 [Tulasnella calospora MUT 4182]